MDHGPWPHGPLAHGGSRNSVNNRRSRPSLPRRAPSPTRTNGSRTQLAGPITVGNIRPYRASARLIAKRSPSRPDGPWRRWPGHYTIPPRDHGSQTGGSFCMRVIENLVLVAHKFTATIFFGRLQLCHGPMFEAPTVRIGTRGVGLGEDVLSGPIGRGGEAMLGQQKAKRYRSFIELGLLRGDSFAPRLRLRGSLCEAHPYHGSHTRTQRDFLLFVYAYFYRLTGLFLDVTQNAGYELYFERSGI